MGTMDIITLDESNASIFIIDETPNMDESVIINEMPIMEEVTNKRRTLIAKKRKSSDKRIEMVKMPKVGKPLGTLPNDNDQWLLIGSPQKDSVETQKNRILQMRKGKKKSETPKKSQMKKNKKWVSPTIVIASDNEDSYEGVVGTNGDNVIVLSDDDDDIGIIGGSMASNRTKRIEHQESMVQQIRFNPWTWKQAKMNHHQVNNRNPPVMQMQNNKLLNAARRKNKPRNQFGKFDKNIQHNGGNKKKPKTSATPTENRQLRPIVIDGSNVAFGHGNNAAFSSRGLEICCDYFLKRGHAVKAFIPQFRRRHHATHDSHILDKLEKQKTLIFTPSRSINGKKIVSYDDRYIVEYAASNGGVIVSRDNFQDLISENHEWRETIQNRLLMYTWVDDVLMFPNDPLGKFGPLLDEFLTFPERPLGDIPSTSEDATRPPQTQEEPSTSKNP